MMNFFQPDDKMASWIVQYAAGRMIIDLGCGSGHVVDMLLENGANACIGVDMRLDHRAVSAIKAIHCHKSVHFIEGTLTDNMVQTVCKMDKPKLMLLCRPCHSSLFIDSAIKLAKDSNAELLYIGLERNIEDDLGLYSYGKLQHEGSSKENEVVLSLITKQYTSPFRKYGYIAPDGTFYECGYAQHYHLTDELLEKGILQSNEYGIDEAEFFGFIKMTGSMFTDTEVLFRFGLKKVQDEEIVEIKKLSITKEQLKTLLDYKKEIGEDHINFNFQGYSISDFLESLKKEGDNYVMHENF